MALTLTHFFAYSCISVHIRRKAKPPHMFPRRGFPKFPLWGGMVGGMVGGWASTRFDVGGDDAIGDVEAQDSDAVVALLAVSLLAGVVAEDGGSPLAVVDVEVARDGDRFVYDTCHTENGQDVICLRGVGAVEVSAVKQGDLDQVADVLGFQNGGSFSLGVGRHGS